MMMMIMLIIIIVPQVSALRSLVQRHGVLIHALGTSNFISKAVNMRTFYPKMGFFTDIPLEK